MIRLTDAFRLTRTKFQTRKFRSVFAAFSLSLALIIILLFIIGGNGVLNFAKQTFKDTLSNRYFAAEDFVNAETITEPTSSGAISQTVTSTSDEPPKPVNPNEYLEKYRGSGVKAVYVQKMIDPYQPNYALENTNDTGLTLSLSASDSLFVQDFLYQDYTFENQYEGKIPVIIPEELVIQNSDPAYYNLTSEERYRKLQESLTQYIGKSFKIVNVTYELNEKSETPESTRVVKPTDLEVIVVGVSRSSFGAGYLPGFNIVVPLWALDTQPTLKSKVEMAQTRLVYEFETKNQRDEFTKTAAGQIQGGMFGGGFAVGSPLIMPVFGPFEMFRQGLNFFRVAAMIVGGLFLVISAISLMTTLGKIIGDSKQEIGIFRATGAQRSDIRKIYFAYTFTLAGIAYAFGLIISYGLLAIASSKWGEQLYYQLASFGTSTDVSVPRFIFVSFPFLHLAGFFIFALLFGLLASAIPILRASRLDPVTVLRDL